MTINQSVVSSNIRALQSLTDCRGKRLASLEAERRKVKAVIKGLRELDCPVPSQLREQFHTVVATIRGEAKHQTLFRQLLKQQYVLHAWNRPKKDARPSFKPGDLVVINKGADSFFQAGLKARLVRFDILVKEWEADFRYLGNPEGSFDDTIDGMWYIGNGKQATFEKFEQS